MDAMSSCLAKVLEEVESRQVTSVHVAKFSHEVEGLNWEMVEDSLTDGFVKSGILTYVYTQGASPVKRKREDEDDNETPQPKKLKSNNSKFFSGISAIFYGNIASGLLSQFQSFGGTVVDDEDNSVPLTSVTHIVTDKSWSKLFGAVLSENPKCQIVSLEWLKNCVNSKQLCDTKPFYVKKA